MIIRPRTSFFKMFFVMRGSIVPRIRLHIIGFGVYAAAVVAAAKLVPFDLGNYGMAPFTLLGVTLSIYLGFRNNAAYDRWWEARKLWGQLVFDVRNLSRAALVLIPAEADQIRPLLMEAAAFCHFLRGQLRDVDASAAARTLIGAEVDALVRLTNRPDELLRRMARRLGSLKAAGRIDSMDFRILDERLASMAAVQAGCERIATTPLPFAYTLLVHRSAYIFCLLLPFGLSSSTGWYTPLFTMLVSYSFFGLDALSEELEEPFGTAANDLALDGLCRVCEISVFEALGETPPEKLVGENFYYS
jgi:ion channel-forming bestrophin family protein